MDLQVDLYDSQCQNDERGFIDGLQAVQTLEQQAILVNDLRVKFLEVDLGVVFEECVHIFLDDLRNGVNKLSKIKMNVDSVLCFSICFTID